MKRSALIGLMLIGFACSGTSQARAIIIEGTLDTCSIRNDLMNNGSVQLEIGVYDPDPGGLTGCDTIDPTTFDPFSINYFGTTYTDLFVNENGSLTFGASGFAGAATTSLVDLGIDIIAPFSADVGLTASSGDVRWGFGGASLWVTWSSVGEQGSSTGERNSFQVAILDRSFTTGNAGDFDLQFNYGAIGWDPGFAGFASALGDGIQFPGSGVPGALIGDDFSGMCGPFSVTCGRNVDDVDIDNEPVFGRYVFEFRNGVLMTGLTPIPEPGSLLLVGLGLILLRLRQRA